MLRKLVFAGMVILLMVSFSVVLADQDGNYRWCNSDQYGCWVTGENGEQIYIMFWSGSACELFMGPGSNAVISDPLPAGEMSLEEAPAEEPAEYTWKNFIHDYWSGLVGREGGYEHYTQAIADQWTKDDIKEIGGLIENGTIEESDAIDYFHDLWKDTYYYYY